MRRPFLVRSQRHDSNLSSRSALNNGVFLSIKASIGLKDGMRHGERSEDSRDRTRCSLTQKLESRQTTRQDIKAIPRYPLPVFYLVNSWATCIRWYRGARAHALVHICVSDGILTPGRRRLTCCPECQARYRIA